MIPQETDNSELDIVVVIPVARFDWNLAKKLLRWLERLGDATKDAKDIATVIVLTSPALTDGQREALDTNAIVVVADGIDEKPGYFGVANQVFKAALDYVEKNHPGQAMLWLEADAVPTRPTWFKEIRDEYRACGKPFMGEIIRCERDHMTGNGVYSPEWRKFAPSMILLPGPDPRWGFDSQCAHEIVPQAHNAKTIQQVWRPELPMTETWWDNNIRPSTALFHQCKDGSLIDRICEAREWPLIPLDAALCESTYETDRHNGSGPQFQHGAKAGPPPERQITGMEILIVTFARDMDYLRNCLQSVEMYARRFHGVTVVVPTAEKEQFAWVSRYAVLKTFDEAPGKGFLHHMIQKCRADEWCPNAEAILIMDPDCMFWQTATPQDFVRGGRVMMVRERYADIKNPNRVYWQGCVERAVGFKPDYECMVCHPQVYLREVFAKTRQLIERHTGKNFDDFVFSQQNEFPQTFCEFNTLGAVAIRYFGFDYHFVDYDRHQDAKECALDGNDGWQYIYRRDRNRIVEFWSHAKFAQYASDANAFLNKRVPAYYTK
jgi:hypothetical protein